MQIVVSTKHFQESTVSAEPKPGQQVLYQPQLHEECFLLQVLFGLAVLEYTPTWREARIEEVAEYSAHPGGCVQAGGEALARRATI